MANNYQILSEDSIKYLCGLIRDLANVSEGIDNINLADDKTFSNIYIKNLIDKCLEDANAEAEKLVGALTHLTCEETVIQPTLDNSEINVIYLYSANGNPPYQQFLKISEDKLVDLGSTSISLEDYIKVADVAKDYATKVELKAVTDKIGTTTLTTTDTTITGAIEEVKGIAVSALGDKNFFSTAPIGTILSFAGQTAPHGYLLCDGASYKVADYPDLYAVIGNTYGGDTENFNVPNLVDKFIQGSTTSGTEKEAGLPNITGGWMPSVPVGYENYVTGAVTNEIKSSGLVSSSGTQLAIGAGFKIDASKSSAVYGKSDTVQPPSLTMVYIIKAFHTNEGMDSGISDVVINYINNSNSYSTEETLTGGKWIDGKPIYRKVCVFKISEEVNAYDLSDLNFDECWITNGFVKQTDGTVNYPMNFFRNNADDLNGAWIRLKLKQLVVQVANLDWFNNNAYVVIEYTKTTDA